MASRVVPGTSETTNRSWPSSALTRVDLPTLGRPTMARRIGPVGRSPSPTSSGPRVLRRAPARAAAAGPGGPSAATIASMQIAHAAPVLGRDREDLAEAELVEVGQRDLLLGAGGVHLVDRHEERLLGAAQQVGHRAVHVGEPLAAVHHQHDGGRLLGGQLGLAAHLAHELVAGLRLEAAGVHHARPTCPPRSRRRSSGRGSRPGRSCTMAAPAAHPVEERRLADVGPAHQGHDGARAHLSTRRTAASRSVQSLVHLDR